MAEMVGPYLQYFFCSAFMQNSTVFRFSFGSIQRRLSHFSFYQKQNTHNMKHFFPYRIFQGASLNPKLGHYVSNWRPAVVYDVLSLRVTGTQARLSNLMALTQPYLMLHMTQLTTLFLERGGGCGACLWLIRVRGNLLICYLLFCGVR